MREPVVKWSGSKRSQADELIRHFPTEIGTYYEPFCGGASVLRALIDHTEVKVGRYVCSDLNDGLIGLWHTIMENPERLADVYEQMWNELNADDDKERKKEYFATVRKNYNNLHDPYLFMFIMRTTTNGMPRYNSNGDFNNSFHVTRDGIRPERLRPIIMEWSELLNTRNVEFRCVGYDEIKPQSGDFVYLDPPYANTKGMYYGALDNERFFDWLRTLECGYALSFDGISGEVDNTYDMPKDLYDEHLYIRSGNSSFKRTIGKSNDSIVYESLYLKKK